MSNEKCKNCTQDKESQHRIVDGKLHCNTGFTQWFEPEETTTSTGFYLKSGTYVLTSSGVFVKNESGDTIEFSYRKIK